MITSSAGIKDNKAKNMRNVKVNKRMNASYRYIYKNDVKYYVSAREKRKCLKWNKQGRNKPEMKQQRVEN